MNLFIKWKEYDFYFSISRWKGKPKTLTCNVNLKLGMANDSVLFRN